LDPLGKLYVGGSFTGYSGTAGVNFIARLNSDGTLDTTFVTGTGFNGIPRAILPMTDGSGRIYAAGGFTTYNGTAVPGLVRLHSNGELDTSFNVTGFEQFQAHTAVLAEDGGVYVSLPYDKSYDGGPVKALVRLKSDGSVDTGFNVFGTWGFDAAARTSLPVA